MFYNRFRNKLLQWYDIHGRDLPWVNESDPYKIWLCEVIMQQTQVAQGLSYYYKFINAFPTIFDLAKVDEHTILKMWEGLGYYSRARNLHATAQIIVKIYNGVFPDSYKELIELKGIGSYMAGAILSFAWNKPYCVADANVNRIIARFYGLQSEINSIEFNNEVQVHLQKCFDKKQAAKFNQAMMDFGSLVCKAKLPDCMNCPMSKNCYAYQNNLQDVLPIKPIKKSRRNRYFNYLVFRSGNKTIITQRLENDIWKNLFQFPLFETIKVSNWKSLQKTIVQMYGSRKLSPKPLIIKAKPQQLTHQLIHATFYIIEVDDFNGLKLPEDKAVTLTGIKKYTFPGIIRDFFNQLT
ncbi:MAG: A/G-specific adenine glycosylase [Bacteroidetes bacterium]|nr:A/G-specific adenine glycosylase [Bacteroidota bacterium]MBK8486875.1 A/G-specific adenine glycosylase [Bacteroidota bacterium]